MNSTLYALLIAASIFFGMLLFTEIGHRIGVARVKRNPEGLAKGSGAAESAVFGLLGLMIAFTFSDSVSRFADRRDLINKEADSIGTAYLRVDLLPSEFQPEVRELFRRYVDKRINTHLTENVTETKTKLAEIEKLQNEIWAKSLVAASHKADTSATMLMLPSLNAMMDSTSDHITARQNHPPIIIFILLVSLSFLGAMLIGYSTADNKDRDWLHPIIFITVISFTVYMIGEFEFPRIGLIRLDSADQVLVDLRNTMN